MTDLRQIQQLVNEACEMAAEQKGNFKHEAINWGDLRCVDVRRWESILDDTGIEVLIEEAATDSTGFCNFVRLHIESHGIIAEVRTEW